METGPLSEDEHSSRARWTIAIPCALIAGATFAVFSPALSNDFVNWDDKLYLVDNPHYRGLGWDQIRWAFTTLYGGPYQPLSWLTYGLDWVMWGREPLGYHLTNMVLHALNAVVLFGVALQILRWTLPQSGRGATVMGAGIAAMLFGVHPLRVESVVWATERRDVLSGLFFLSSIWFYLRWCRCRRSDGGESPWPVMAFIAFCLSLLSKGMGVTLPAILLVLDWYPLRRIGNLPASDGARWPTGETRRALVEKVPFFLASLVIGLVAILGVTRSDAISSADSLNAFERIVVSGYSMVFYVAKSLAPVGLSPLYEFPINIDAVHWRYLGSAILFAMAAVVAYRVRNRYPAMVSASLCYVLIVLPVSGLLHAGPQLVADRYSYLATMSFAILIGAAWLRVWSRPSLAPQRTPLIVLAILILCGLGALTWKQTRIWHDSITLWKHVARLNPDSYVAQNNLGICFFKLGQTETAQEHYRRAIELNPNDHKPYFNLGQLYLQLDEHEDAAAAFQAALKIDPTLHGAYTSLGNLRLKDSLDEEAVELYYRALEYKPEDVPTLTNLGEALIRLGRSENALDPLRLAVELEPDRIEARFNLGRALQGVGRIDEAIAEFQRCRKIDPDHLKSADELAAMLVLQKRFDEAVEMLRVVVRLSPDDVTTLSNLGAALLDSKQYRESFSVLSKARTLAPQDLSTSLALSRLLSSAPEDDLRDGDEAARLALRVCEATQFRSASALDALAAAYAEMGRFDDASQTALEAAKIARRSGRATLADEIEARRAGYANDQPYRRPSP